MSSWPALSFRRPLIRHYAKGRSSTPMLATTHSALRSCSGVRSAVPIQGNPLSAGLLFLPLTLALAIGTRSGAGVCAPSRSNQRNRPTTDPQPSRRKPLLPLKRPFPSDGRPAQLGGEPYFARAPGNGKVAP